MAKKLRKQIIEIRFTVKIRIALTSACDQPQYGGCMYPMKDNASHIGKDEVSFNGGHSLKIGWTVKVYDIYGLYL